jgi:hypothetical protein
MDKEFEDLTDNFALRTAIVFLISGFSMRENGGVESLKNAMRILKEVVQDYENEIKELEK